MKVRIRFFARFRELLGTDIIAEPPSGTTFGGLVREATRGNGEGFLAIFAENGAFRAHVILMRTGKRVAPADAERAPVADGDGIAVFPPVSGG